MLDAHVFGHRVVGLDQNLAVTHIELDAGATTAISAMRGSGLHAVPARAPRRTRRLPWALPERGGRSVYSGLDHGA